MTTRAASIPGIFSSPRNGEKRFILSTLIGALNGLLFMVLLAVLSWRIWLGNAVVSSEYGQNQIKKELTSFVSANKEQAAGARQGDVDMLIKLAQQYNLVENKDPIILYIDSGVAYVPQSAVR